MIELPAQGSGYLPAELGAPAQAPEHMAALEDSHPRAAWPQQGSHQPAVHHPGVLFPFNDNSAPLALSLRLASVTGCAAVSYLGACMRKQACWKAFWCTTIPSWFAGGGSECSPTSISVHASKQGEQGAFTARLTQIYWGAAGGGVSEIPAAGSHGCAEWAHSGVCPQAGQAGLHPAHRPQHRSGKYRTCACFSCLMLAETRCQSRQSTRCIGSSP